MESGAPRCGTLTSVAGRSPDTGRGWSPLHRRSSGKVTVQPDGCIYTVMVPDQLAYGLTVLDLDAAPRRDCSRLLKNPDVNGVPKYPSVCYNGVV
jgi:hypothetical protein